jgi:hypothetical protein
MSKRTNLVLFITLIVAFGLLLFLSWLASISGDQLASRSPSLLEARFPQANQESEPNDTIDTANPINVDRTIVGRIPLTQTRDLDWFRLMLAATDIDHDLRANLEESFPDPDYILELNLYDAAGSLIDSASSGSSTSVYWTSAFITYYLRARAVFFDVGADRDADYELAVLYYPPTPTPEPIKPTLHISYREGAPGSVFTLTGLRFPRSDQVAIQVNGHPISAVSSSSGWFRFLLDTANADEGFYIVTTQIQSATAFEFFVLDSGESVREPQDDGPEFPVPPGIAFANRMFLPSIVNRE